MGKMTMKEIAALCRVSYCDVTAAARRARGGKRQRGQGVLYELNDIRPYLVQIISERIDKAEGRLEDLHAMLRDVELADCAEAQP